MALTEAGLTIERFPEIFAGLNSGIKSLLGNDVDTSEFSLIGNLHSNLAIKLAELNELALALYDAGNLYNAEGIALDNIAIQYGITRRQTTKTSGTEYFTAANGTAISKGSRYSTNRGDFFVTTEAFVVDSLECVQTRLYVNTVVNSTSYRVVINGVVYSITSDGSATRNEILTAIESAISVDGSVDLTLSLDTVDQTKSYLLIDKIVKTSTMNVTGSSYFTFDYVVTPAELEAEQFGPIAGDALTITTINTSATGLYSVTNPSDFDLGQTLETDNELRYRILTEFDSIGSGTVNGIITNVLRVDGVEDAILKVNSTSSNLVDGPSTIPPKSFEVIVQGGLNDEVADAIWKSCPAGIYAHGTTEVEFLDFNGYEHTIRFTRPTVVYITVKAIYEPYTEETLPTGAIDAAKQAILEYANTNLGLGTDVIAKRFLSQIYGTASGFGDITIQVAEKPNPNDVVGPGDYVDVVTISDREITSFALNRIIIEAAP